MSLDWRVACGDEALPSALVVDSRPQPSSLTCFTRSIDGGKNIKDIKLHVVCDKHGSLIDLEVTGRRAGDRVPRHGVRAQSVLRLSVLRLAGQFMCPSWAT